MGLCVFFLDLMKSHGKKLNSVFAFSLIMGSLASEMGSAFQSHTLSRDAGQLLFVPKLGSGVPIPLQSFEDVLEFSGIRDYQIGDEWGKKEVEPSKLSQRDSVYVRAVQATAFFNSATSFYLGKFGGEHVMATNHHVLSSDAGCRGRTVHFSLRDSKYSCKAMIGSWSDVDLALFTLEADPKADQDLSPYAKNFDFNSVIFENTSLLTAGFGIAGNRNRKMMVNENSDCRVISGRDEFRYMADPDQLNPAEYKTWSFATGCSVSHGDSGSAIVNRTSGAVLGLLWTGAIPKEARIQDSNYLKEIQVRRDGEIWQLLTYAVPAKKIAEQLNSALNSGELAQQHISVVREILSKN